jgi:hypothetical protein
LIFNYNFLPLETFENELLNFHAGGVSCNLELLLRRADGSRTQQQRVFADGFAGGE